jgi:hypothetical protein
VVPDGPWQKVAVGARHRLFLEAYSRRQNEASKPLKDAFYAMLVCEINNLSWSDPAQWDTKALRVGTPIVVLIWNDSEYGLITWHQLRRFGRPSHIQFNNPDFVKYAESFGAKGYRIERANDLAPTLKRALVDNTVAIIDCPVDYSENMKLTERLATLKSPL